MNRENFDLLLNRRLKLTEATLAAKGREYSTNADKLYNFKRAAIIRNTNPADTLLGMWMKHLVSILDMIEGVRHGVVPTQEQVDEKIGDSINYSILLEAIFDDIRPEDDDDA